MSQGAHVLQSKIVTAHHQTNMFQIFLGGGGSYKWQQVGTLVICTFCQFMELQIIILLVTEGNCHRLWLTIHGNEALHIGIHF